MIDNKKKVASLADVKQQEDDNDDDGLSHATF
jgi:hypothetical protein